MTDRAKCLNVLVVAEDGAGSAVLRLLCATAHRVVAVLTTPPGDAARPAGCWNVARSLGRRTLPARSVAEPGFADVVRQEQVDLLLNVHSLVVIPSGVLTAPRIGCFNVHPGPLPRYAGLNAPNWAIYRGEREHGVTVHRMEPAIDAGAIAYQRLFPIGDDDTGLSLATRCGQEGLALVRELLAAAAAADPRGIPRVPQDLTRREYFGGEVPEGGRVNWFRPARDVVNFLRAACYHPFVSPWGHPATSIGRQEIGVVSGSLSSRAADARPGTVAELVGPRARVACADGCVLIHKVHVGGAYRNAADVLSPGVTLGPDLPAPPPPR
jgi:methionyl-tRNA formyltransferase